MIKKKQYKKTFNKYSFIASVLLFAAFGAGIYSFAGLGNQSVFEAFAASSYPTIPVHDNSIPPGAIFVSPSGNDNNSGTISSPLRTINNGIDKISAGGTIVVREGVYREGNKWVFKQINLMSYPGEQVWMTGMDVVTNWTNEGNGRYSISWDTPDYCGGKYYQSTFVSPNYTGSCMFSDNNGGDSNPMAWDPQMVYLNDDYIKQVDSLSKVSGTTFYYNLAAKKLTIGFNPSGQKVEVSKRPHAFIFSGTSQNSSITGIGFMRYATDTYSSNLTNSVVYAARDGMTVDKSYVWQMAGGGVGGHESKNFTVKNSIFKDNGSNGAGANGSKTTSGQIDNVVFENNVFDNNNLENFGENCSASCGQAGVKMAHIVGAEIRHNLFINNNGNGYWCDLACKDVNMYGNYVANNKSNGLYYEVSEGGIIASNLVINNGWKKGIEYGIRVSAYGTKIYNNTLIDNAMHIQIYDDSRPYQAGQWGPNTGNIEIVNNVMSGGNIYRMVTISSGSYNMSDFISKYNYNSYFRPGNTPTTIMFHEKSSGNKGHSSIASITNELGYEANGIDNNGNSDPFFVNESAGDYRIRSNSNLAYKNGLNLPADIYNILKYKPAANVSRGAVYWVKEDLSYVLSPQDVGPALKQGDINNDGKVDIVDLSILLSAWGTTNSQSDINSDGKVDIVDLSILLSNWS